MEKRRSSRKHDSPILRSTDEASAEELFRQARKRIFPEFSWQESTDLKAFGELLHRWIELNDPKASLDLERILSAAERLTQKIILDADWKPRTGIWGLTADLGRIDVAFKALRVMDERAAKVFVLSVVEGKTEEEAASALETSREFVRNSLRRARRLISESLENNISFRSIEDFPEKHASSELDSRLPEIIARATEVIGDRQEAMRWLGTPVRGLDYATPISLLATEGGAERVDDILGQIEHGIW